ncbi:GINS complex subunit [Scheffersomyces spartinae]|uniref:DNA replication complex GINS protein SLD5 n=1 Tax=Scheffersomyces spartinae TaxID=45513 RepID=A0A9P7V5D4_9ASCO|nr:GINS complex subunit [Scheffersomyces spartinae]KAG7191444.1 GINS complex subunit [Scheffersomyces spartinae]
MSRHDINDILEDFESTAKTTPVSVNICNELTTAMINERMAPELLPYNHQLMAKVLLKLSAQQQYLLDAHEYGDANVESGVISSDFKLQLMIIETDIERVNYLVRLYLRTRISKLDNFSLFYIRKSNIELDVDVEPETKSTNKNAKPSHLSDEELEYIHNHFRIMSDLFNNSFLKKLPRLLALLDETSPESMITEPDLNEPVFFRSLSRETIRIDGEDELDIIHDGVYVARYRLVQSYVHKGDIVLI